MPYKNPAVAKEKKHEYYVRNKEHIMSKVAEYRKEHPEMVKTINRKYNQKKNAPYHTVLANAGIDRVCEECGSAEYVCTHHKDHNRSNNSLDNLQWLCVRCHGKLHRREQLSVPPTLRSVWLGGVTPYENTTKVVERKEDTTETEEEQEEVPW